MVVALVMMTAAVIPASAQFSFNNAISQYYRDGYLWNPALAGNQHTRFFALRNGSWSGFDGSSVLYGLAADFDFHENMGAGIHLASFSSGIIRRYAGALSYSYKIPVSEKGYFRIGGDLSFFKGHLDTKDIGYGGQADPEAVAFNDRGVRFNGDTGAWFEANGFSAGATGYNLGSVFKKSADRLSDIETAELMAAYKIRFSNKDFSLQPLVSYKVFYAADDIFTAAAQLDYRQLFYTSLYWESTGSVMGGIGFTLKDAAEINVFYCTRNRYGYHEQFEVGLKYLIK
jgi:type IX secretion system PorP/SprF family membrane protein